MKEFVALNDDVAIVSMNMPSATVLITFPVMFISVMVSVLLITELDRIPIILDNPN
jgi:hypothetical protein